MHAWMSQVADAACMANAMDFIKRLPEEFSTKVRPRGLLVLHVCRHFRLPSNLPCF
jgi:ABC-type transport system involved in Fe-S cluster assembly fused permease/ATPase subunit